MGWVLTARLRRIEEPLALGAAGLVILTVAMLPMLFMAGEAIATPAELLASAAGLVSTRIWELLLRSLILAGSVNALSLLAGVPLGLLLGRTDIAGRGWALLLHAFPMFLPPFLLALGWFHIFGTTGFCGTEATSRLLFGPLGNIGIQTIAFTPIVTSLVALALQGIDPSLEEAARTVASPWRVATRILLPMTWPAAGLAALVVFALSLSELGVPMFLRVQVYPAAVFARLGGIQYAPGEAFVLVLPLLAISIALLAAERRLISRRPTAVLGLRLCDRPALRLKRWRAPATAGCWLASMLGVLPIAALAFRAGRGGGFTAAPAWLGASLQNILLPAAAASTVLTAAGCVLGRAIVRRRPGVGLFDALTVLAFVTPATVLSVGLITVWNRPATQIIYGSTMIIILGYIGRYSVIASRTIAAAVAQGHPHLEEVAMVYGARFRRRLVRVLLPVHARAVAATWLLTLVFCLRDLETTIPFYPPGREPLPVRIFTLAANGPEEVVAALAVVHVVLTGVILTAGSALIWRSRPS